MLVSVIVITYHRNEFLQSTIGSILTQQDLPTPCELIVIDNGGDADVPDSPRADISVRVVRPSATWVWRADVTWAWS